MKQLNLANLSTLNSNVRLPTYDRSSIKPGIVHFGVGNFHRTHQAIYCDNLLCQGETEWGLIGVSMRSPVVRDALAPQNFLYTEATLGNETTVRVIGSILDILVAPEEPSAVIGAVANNQVQVVTTTITEKGYHLASGEIDLNHPSIRQDMQSLNAPQTIYGYLAAAVIKRRQQGGEPLTVICCDNLRGGGEYLGTGVFKLLEQHCTASEEWTKQYVSFVSSMVDRVSPATDNQLTEWVSTQLGAYDNRPVSAEPFSQWVIQDQFAGKRPPFDKVGATFVDDVTTYEQMKLRLLNAGHSIASVLGYLAGEPTIHQTLQHRTIVDFVTRALRHNVLPATVIPLDSNGYDYIDSVLQRFHNQALPYSVLQVGTDSSQKIQQRWLPTIDDALNQGTSTTYFEFSLAAWVAYIHSAVQQGELEDPLQDSFLGINRSDTLEPVSESLALAGARNFCFYGNQTFMASVHHYYRTITTLGIEQALSAFLTTAS